LAEPPFQFQKRSQQFIRTHNVTHCSHRCDYWSALFAQQVDTNRPFQFQKRAQLFIGAHNKAPSVVAVRISNPDCSPVGIISRAVSLLVRRRNLAR